MLPLLASMWPDGGDVVGTLGRLSATYPMLLGCGTKGSIASESLPLKGSGCSSGSIGSEAALLTRRPAAAVVSGVLSMLSSSPNIGGASPDAFGGVDNGTWVLVSPLPVLWCGSGPAFVKGSGAEVSAVPRISDQLLPFGGEGLSLTLCRGQSAGTIPILRLATSKTTSLFSMKDAPSVVVVARPSFSKA